MNYKVRVKDTDIYFTFRQEVEGSWYCYTNYVPWRFASTKPKREISSADIPRLKKCIRDILANLYADSEPIDLERHSTLEQDPGYTLLATQELELVGEDGNVQDFDINDVKIKAVSYFWYRVTNKHFFDDWVNDNIRSGYYMKLSKNWTRDVFHEENQYWKSIAPNIIIESWQSGGEVFVEGEEAMTYFKLTEDVNNPKIASYHSTESLLQELSSFKVRYFIQ